MGAQKNDEIELDLGELFLNVVSHWAAILLCTVLLATVGYSYGRFMTTPLYSSTSVLYVLSKSTSITSVADLQVGANLTNDYLQVIKARPVLERVIENLGLNMTYGQLASTVSVTNQSNTRMLGITVRNKDIKQAKMIADEIADVSSAFISEKMDQDPPTIIQYGYTDAKAVSTSPAKYALYGAAGGLLLAVGVIVLMFLLNDKIMTPEELEKRTGLHSLATLPME